jgi:hypothetical protein
MADASTAVTDADLHAGTGEPPLVDGAEIRRVIEYYYQQDWTDGLPVVPVTESYLADFLARTSLEPDAVLLAMPHLNRGCTVRLAAANAAMAGCLPEYFPVVVAAWEALALDPYPRTGIWQSTTGTAPLTIVNGPVRTEIGLNSRGNVFGSGFRANATIGRAIRLGALNIFGIHPHLLDQATQATPAKYTCCIAENEEESPWVPLHVEHGLDPADSAVTGTVIRSCMHIEARHTHVPEQLALDITNSITRTGALIHEFSSALLVLSPEHAHVFAGAGWSKDDIRRFIHEHAVHSRAQLAAVGKDAISRQTRWRLPADHPDAIPDSASASGDPDRVPMLLSPDAVQIVVAGANNAGVSAIMEVFGPRDSALPMVKIRDLPARDS